jgi:hypothetical protein
LIEDPRPMRRYPDGYVSPTGGPGGSAGGVGPNGQAFTRPDGWHNTDPDITPPAGSVVSNPRGGKWTRQRGFSGPPIKYQTGRPC